MILADQLSKVVDKTTRLIDLCDALQEENDLLKLENESLKVALDAGKTKSIELEEKLKALKNGKIIRSNIGWTNRN